MYKQRELISNNPEQLKEIVDLYKSGMLIKDIEKQLDISRATIRRRLKKQDIEIRPIGCFRTDLMLSNSMRAVDLYNSGLTIKQVSNEVNVPWTTVQRYLGKLNCKMRPANNIRKYTLNESVFEELNPESSYWIGFLLADGCIYKHKKWESYTTQLALARKDKLHVKKFKEFVGSNEEVYDYKVFSKKTNRFSYGSKLRFCSKKIYDDLIPWCILPQKSTREKVHPKLKFNRDFWRGYFDGDGCFTRDGKAGQFVSMLVGSVYVIRDFADFLDSHNIKHGKVLIKDGRGLYKLNVSSERRGKHGSKGNQFEDYNHINNLHRLLYKDASTYLDRKYNYFKNIKCYKY